MPPKPCAGRSFSCPVPRCLRQTRMNIIILIWLDFPLISPDGEPLGEIVTVQNFGAGDLLELRLSNGRQTLLIPFESAHVPKVDLEAKRITIIIPNYEEQ